MQTYAIDQLMGQTLGNYRLERRIGANALQTVYLAHHQLLKRRDRLTFYRLPEHGAAHEKFRVRFRKEATAVIGLRHPHILPVYEYGEYAGYPYLVTSHEGQGSLATIVKRQGPCEHACVDSILKQLARGLAYAHGEGFIHGMLQPATVLLHAEGVMRIAGFGLMHMLQRSGIERETEPFQHMLSIANSVLIAPEYVAPEVVEGQAIDVRSDIYSLGCMVFELLSGHPPFYSGKPLDIARRHVTQPMPMLHRIHPAVPVALAVVVHQALERDPLRRFADVSEFRDAFAKASMGVVHHQIAWVSNEKSVLEHGEAGEMALYKKDAQAMAPSNNSSAIRTPVSDGGTNGRRATFRPNSWQLVPPVVTDPRLVAQRAIPLQAQGSTRRTDPAMSVSKPEEQFDAWLFADEMQDQPCYPDIEREVMDVSTGNRPRVTAPRRPAPPLPTTRQAVRQGLQQQPHKVKRRKVVALLAAGGGALVASAIMAVNIGHFNVNDTPPLQMLAQVRASLGESSATGTASSMPESSGGVQSAGKSQLHLNDAPAGNPIGSLKQPRNTAIQFVDPSNKQAGVLIHLPQGIFVAYQQACTHEGVPVQYDPEKEMLVCPAHGAMFDPLNGQVIQGPAQRSLPRTRIRVNSSGTISTF